MEGNAETAFMLYNYTCNFRRKPKSEIAVVVVGDTQAKGFIVSEIN